jgi:hypothetical protein
LKFDMLSNRIIGCAIEVHKHLGPGLLESTYEQCLAYDRIDIEFQRQTHEKWHQADGLINASCSSCSSWYEINLSKGYLPWPPYNRKAKT